MKRSLQISLLSITVLCGAFLFTQMNSSDEQSKYQPREFSENTSLGGIEYVQQMKVNQITGTIDPDDVVAAQNQVMYSANKTSSLGLQWESKGPNNFGGRTRGLLFDKDNPNIMFMGGVAGGIFRSKSGGSSWVPIHEDSPNGVVTSIAQSADGTLYYGTGEGLYVSTVGRFDLSPGLTGGGMFKSTDGGDTWASIPSTVPATISGSAQWAAIGNIITHPTNANTMWVGTNRGIRYTTDGGATWSNPVSVPGSTAGVTDMHMDSQNGIWASLGGRVFYSADGISFNEISKAGAGPTDLPRGLGRVKVVTAPADNNYVYVTIIAANDQLDRFFKSTDKGATWTVIGQQTNTWDPFQAFDGLSLSGNGQGGFDLAMAVDPSDKERLIIGGIDLWEYTATGGWSIVSQWFANQPTPWAVHADQHNIFYHPTKSNEFYVVNDGGLYKTSDNGFSFVPLTKEYNTIQFYGIGVGQDKSLIGGTQDNGTLLNDGSGNTSGSSVEVRGGDGGQAAISWLDGDVYFAWTNRNHFRTENAADSWQGEASWFSADMQAAARAWNTPFQLYETESDPNSTDSSLFVAFPGLRSLGFGNGVTDSFYNNLGRPQESADFDAATFVIFAGGDTLRSDAQGNLSGDGTGMFNAATGEFYVIFDDAPSAEIIALCEVSYSVGSELVLESNINGLPYRYNISSTLRTGDSLYVQDPVQAFFVVGMSGSVWLTRQPHVFGEVPEWWRIANMSGQTATTIEVSADGDAVYVGTSAGRIITISNLSQARSAATADVTSGTFVTNITNTVVAGGRFVTSISADPNDNDRVVVTLGNYGNTSYVSYSTNATSANPSYVSKQGSTTNGLLRAPVYASVIDKGDGKKVILGTEYGIYTTNDITVASPTWTAENDGFANVAVMDLIQYRTNKSSDSTTTIKEGDIFIGSHARGWYVSTSLQTDRPLSTEENVLTETKEARESLKMYPNPASEFTNVDVTLNGRGDVKASIIDMSGRTVKTVSLKGLPQGDHKVRIDLTGVNNGSYVLSITANGTVSNGKFIVNK